MRPWFVQFFNAAKEIISPPPMKFGIDVSKHNGDIDWSSVKTNDPKVDFAFLKASEGATVMDKKFYRNVDGCAENGIPWGAYHFATWNDEDEEKDARNEARFFLGIVKSADSKPKMPLVLDIETNKPIPYTKDEMEVYVKTFTEEVRLAGYEPAIYASPGFLNSYLRKDHPFTGIKLWAADYTGAINPVPGWKSIWLHQYTQTGKVKGIKTTVDLNRVIS
jgi:lysozyme